MSEYDRSGRGDGPEPRDAPGTAAVGRERPKLCTGDSPLREDPFTAALMWAVDAAPVPLSKEGLDGFARLLMAEAGGLSEADGNAPFVLMETVRTRLLDRFGLDALIAGRPRQPSRPPVLEGRIAGLAEHRRMNAMCGAFFGVEAATMDRFLDVRHGFEAAMAWAAAATPETTESRSGAVLDSVATGLNAEVIRLRHDTRGAGFVLMDTARTVLVDRYGLDALTAMPGPDQPFATYRRTP